MRVYRHYSWIFVAISVILTASVAGGLVQTLGTLSVDAVCKAAFLLMIYVVLEALPFVALRWKTVVDDEAVTQHWFLNTYRIPLAEITGVERDAGFARWFLRLRTGEKSFEVLPCYVYQRPGGPLGAKPPRKLLALQTDIDQRRKIGRPVSSPPRGCGHGSSHE
ncbi:hypothetical protein GCM10010168_31210 [Actinoplanes ianthinogenes]|uniref:Uncharacterized protein n=1 Tax=Actinoplanes ianthinogenes TaxID=122358 RepID=A0ABN6C6K9_9ACTN|nr:hypothetical protein [Actinoplanes ianthinogenes]BCJ40263.1 hypothetical protein Aiant_09200 [Actinoplanes ianthinogenes]GGR11253.1 hypothetical protein GCM10010168_31210 [Actinoplanes ianthinogenes]